MNRTIRWASVLVAVFLFSVACELGLGLPTPAPEGVELSVLVLPADKGYVELDGSLIRPGVSVPLQRGKLVNLVAIPLDEEWRFARWERDLTGINSEEALLVDGSKVVRAVFVPVDPLAAVLEPTSAPPDTVVPPTPAPVTAPVSPAPAPVPASTTEPVEAPAPIPAPDTASESPAPGETEVPPPVASFSIDVSSGSTPFAVQFSDTSLGTHRRHGVAHGYFIASSRLIELW